MKIFAGLLFVLITLSANAQIVYEFDTLTYANRTTGDLDSIDIKTAYLPTVFDGGRPMLSLDGLSIHSVVHQIYSPVMQPSFTWGEMRFSGLPHLGFTYSIGGQGSQFIRAQYNHAITQKTLLNIDYERNSGLGSIRNAGFNNDCVQLQLQRKGQRYSLQVKGAFQSFNTNHPGGIITDTLIENFGLEFSPVYKQNAVSRNRMAEISVKNYFNVLKDSTAMLGPVTQHTYKVRNRIYTETDAIFDSYDAVFIDSFSTRDQYNLNELGNGAGAYFASKRFYIDGLLKHVYWDYQNLGSHTDTHEVDLTSSAFLHLNSLKLTNEFNFNILGRFNSFYERVSLKYVLNRFEVNAILKFENNAPSVFQRTYFSNNANYLLTNVENQPLLSVGGNAGYSFFQEKIRVSFLGELTSISNPYMFDGTSWVNTTGNYTFSSLGVRAAFKLGALHFNPNFIYTTSTDNILPEFQAYGRLFVKGKLFKAKKLEALFGIDGSYISAFSTRTYLPHMDTYDWSTNAPGFTPMANLHAFVSLGISEFRFFVRYENIGYFWSDQTNKVLENYPIAGTRLRIGLTWDFFN